MHEGKFSIRAARQVAAIWLSAIILVMTPLYGAHAAQHSGAKTTASDAAETALNPFALG